MHEVLTALLARDRPPVDRPMWHSFWDGLRDGGLQRGETVALLASLSTRTPDQDTLSALLRSLDERRPECGVRLEDTANIVGTGGGPRTFNVSTAAAFVAAAMGVRVVKTGSRAHSGVCGSIDLLERLGIALTTSYEQTAEMVDRFGIAFPGGFVYPRELTLLARSILPLEMRQLGGLVNAIGPFLATMPVSAQLVGVGDPSVLPGLRRYAASVGDRRIWLCVNELGVDELVGSVDNVVHPNDGGTFRVPAEHPGRTAGPGPETAGPGTVTAGPETATAGPGTVTAGPETATAGPGTVTAGPEAGADALAGLRLAATDTGERAAERFLAVLSGQGTDQAARTVRLNAAALAVASGTFATWPDALASAGDALHGGGALRLVERLRAGGAR
ncbi:anthranilate phosphoribosyltransferase [Streptomyces clavuligerus]|uniref:Anthranilate phosphoribosyltransferase n=1 Tax=Streptomyces clavuligerus TaxID=1901 RepID=B5H1H4_STRCL|nr:anthranilate phosphoribosyltransferase [Streptomyces clavuligerus]EDY52420.1 anthranilate phosphoribosyltransferase [Streptomyces clavuligerus]EFG04785.1 Anthranilate phosphoribosyltransferase [Streptomyces clavuligerus]MBY6306767.1 anthranilate phosphoribosyltransferase [Streptomyces clavuligerus]QCS10972.1 anthranilate phosphoribosyltransferase [Streptomyces clavuligerus]QPJ97332.1 anthranilate phosphoribosyltransferase [Streptomyces clavuligerus]